ncbi:hypothetical protein HMPREF2141_00217 [Bacteroides uniformis]|nr:hypothetical protein HMPREF2141_00217 [Bacteroides uniformis]
MKWLAFTLQSHEVWDSEVAGTDDWSRTNRQCIRSKRMMHTEQTDDAQQKQKREA